MKRYKSVLVCVDRPEADAHLLEYAGGRSRVAESAEIHFVHVHDPSAVPTDLAGHSADAAAFTPDTLETLVNEHFKGHGQEQLKCQVISGSPLLETLRFAHDNSVDLIMLGRHFGRTGEADEEATLARRITMKATCSVAVVPERYQLQANEIIVPVRDSDCSANALEVACGIAEVTGAAVTALNIFHVGAGYSRVGTSLEEHVALLEAAAQREYQRLAERVDFHGVPVRCRCSPEMDGQPVPVILEALGDGAGKAVVIGARGRTGAAGVLLGKVTEQLIRRSPSPVLAVKKKGECLGILRAVLALAGET